MRSFRFVALALVLSFGAACSDDSSSDDPISEPDVTREPEEMIDE